MKVRNLLMLFALVCAFGAYAQVNDEEYDEACNCPDQWKAKEYAKVMKEIEEDDELNMKVDTAAHFRGGDSLLQVYMKSRIINPAKNMQDSLKYSILCRFIVEKTGRISNIYFFTHTDELFEREAERFMATMPRWQPAIAKHKKVRSWNLIRLFFGYPDANNVQEEEIPEEMIRAMEEQQRLEEEKALEEDMMREDFHFTDEAKEQFREAKAQRTQKKRSYFYYE